MLKVFYNYDVSPNTENKHEQTLMHIATKDNNIKVLEFLKNQGADVNFQDKNGNSPLFYTNNIETLNWLL